MAKSEQIVSKRLRFRDRHDEGMTAGIHMDILARDLITKVFPILGVCSYTRLYFRCLRTRCGFEKPDFPSI